LIEGDTGLLQLLHLLLDTHYSVKTASNALQALNLLYQGDLPRLMIISLNLEGISGLELINNIKNNGMLRHIPLIAITNEKSEIITKSLNSKVEQLIQKPFDPEELKKIIEKKLYL